jgi:hypothetical protein
MQSQQKDKYAQIIDAAFENAIKLYHAIEREKESYLSFNLDKTLQTQLNPISRREQMFKRRKEEIEADLNVILPIAENFADKMIQKKIDMEIKLQEIRKGQDNKI